MKKLLTILLLCWMVNTLYAQVRVSNSLVNDVDNSKVEMCNVRTDCVWPGDTNKDNVSNSMDLRNIGRAYHTKDIPRRDQAISWDGKFCRAWNSFFSRRVNYKHADCN